MPHRFVEPEGRAIRSRPDSPLAFWSTATPPVLGNLEGAETKLFAGANGGNGCIGCGCAGETDCSAIVRMYPGTDTCASDVGETRGELAPEPVTFECNDSPIGDGLTSGARIEEMRANTSCSPSGTATVDPARWDERARFCSAPDVAHPDCREGETCVPEMLASDICLLANGDVTCPAEYPVKINKWFTGLEDTRSCGRCTCTASGGNCNGVQVQIGSDWTCTDDYAVSTNRRTCQGSYSPPASPHRHTHRSHLLGQQRHLRQPNRHWTAHLMLPAQLLATTTALKTSDLDCGPKKANQKICARLSGLVGRTRPEKANQGPKKPTKRFALDYPDWMRPTRQFARLDAKTMVGISESEAFRARHF